MALKTVEIVPDNCVLIILTPLGRLGYLINENYETYINDIQSFDNYKAFLENPMCYKRNEFMGLYADASVYFPGQSYTDIELGYNRDNDKGSLLESYKGVHTCVFNDSDNKPIYTENDKTDYYSITNSVSNLTYELKGLIFVLCCRDLNISVAENRLNLETTMAMKQYETMISILNRSLYSLKDNLEGNDDKFKNCDAIKVYLAKSSTCKKSYNHFKKRSDKSSQNTIKLLESIQPQLTKISKNATNGDSLNICYILRTLPILDIIIKWLEENNNPETDSMQKIFEELTTKIHNINNIIDIFFNLQIKNFKDKNMGILGIAIQILISYIYYYTVISNITTYKNYNDISYKFNKLFKNTNLYLNNLNINNQLLFTLFYKYEIHIIFLNIYLMDNMIEGIYQFVVEDIIGSNHNVNFFLQRNPINLKKKQYQHKLEPKNYDTDEFKLYINNDNINEYVKDNPLPLINHLQELNALLPQSNNNTQVGGLKKKKIRKQCKTQCKIQCKIHYKSRSKTINNLNSKIYKMK